MHKTKNVKAKDLMIDDHVKVGGKMFRITEHTHILGNKRRIGSVNIGLRTLDTRPITIHLEAAPSVKFTMYNQ